MNNWQYRAYKSDADGKCISEVIEGEMMAENFIQLSLSLRQTGFFVIEATKLNPNDSLATRRLEKMRARVTPEPIVVPHMPETSAIRKVLSWFIPPFLRR